MRDAPDGDGDVLMAGGAVTSFPNASCMEADSGKPHRRSCSGRSSRMMTAVTAAVGDGQDGAWAAYSGYMQRPARRRSETGQVSVTGSGGMEGRPAL